MKVKGYITGEATGGYPVAIAGFITLPEGSPLRTRRIANDKFTIDNINPIRTNCSKFHYYITVCFLQT